MAKILVAVEDFEVRERITAATSAEGHEVIEGDDGQEVVELVSSTLPDLVLVDAMMPVFNGYEVCEMLRNDITVDNALPIIIVTGSDGDPSMRDRVGATEFLAKNHEVHQLRDLLVEQLGPKANPR